MAKQAWGWDGMGCEGSWGDGVDDRKGLLGCAWCFDQEDDIGCVMMEWYDIYWIGQWKKGIRRVGKIWICVFIREIHDC